MEIMEEMKQTALAYHSKLPEQLKNLAVDMFIAMDESGDGRISYGEFDHFLKQAGLQCIADRSVFQALDSDGDGSLDFNEFLTFYYIQMAHRIIFCHVCGVLLTGVYFSCYQCFWANNSNNNNSSGSESDGTATFDLCCDCYRSKSSFDHHEDAVFMDTYALLQAKRQERSENLASTTFDHQLPSSSAGQGTGMRSEDLSVSLGSSNQVWPAGQGSESGMRSQTEVQERSVRLRSKTKRNLMRGLQLIEGVNAVGTFLETAHKCSQM